MFNRQVINEFAFSKESVTIGRKPDNDIVIDNLAVSGYHSRIDKTGPQYILTDLQSTNGTFVNDKRIVSHKLMHGDNTIIGKHVLLFLESSDDEVSILKENQNMALDETMMLDTVKQRELLSKQQKASASGQRQDKVGILSFIDGSKLGEVELKKKLTRIGKSENSEVRLPSLFMGATAATISRRPAGYTITFTGGLTRLKVNGEIVKESMSLNDFDTIELGSHKFQFYQKSISTP
jgi:pSer/pThr/pTyr-binding forkhead associated (FHA) protein